MRLLVCAHDLAIGGSQINAIDLGAAAVAAGHDVIIYGVPGPLVGYIETRGLRYMAAHPLKYRPAPTRIAQIAAIARRERVDLIHAYEWATCLEAYFGATLLGGVPLLCTVLSMQVMPYVPRSVPLIMGTEDLGRDARCVQTSQVWVVEPPIDVEGDNPTVDGSFFRQKHGVAASECLIVSVSRLALDLKLDALVRTLDAADALAARHKIRVILVGDGPARAALTQRASAINARHGREVATLPGADLDPRGAYAAADLVVGMGSSALRAMAIGKPLIVQGERAFSEVFEPASHDLFLQQGFYGLGDDESGSARLTGQIERLIVDQPLRAELGAYGRRIVVERFSLDRAAAIHERIYRQVLEHPPRRSPSDALRAAGLALKLEVANHDPRLKAARRQRETNLLAAAGSSRWPPSQA